MSIRRFDVVHKFVGVLKISSFGSKPKRMSLRFYQKMFVHGKNRLKICISLP
jgi:hypothetical protein